MTHIYFIIFVFGLIVGSFLNCLIYRLEKGKSFLKGRSFCPFCKHSLSWRDLVPVFSFIFLKGKCRYCHQPISFQYPLVEISTALIFLLIFNFFTPLDMQLSNGAIFNFLNIFYLWIAASFLIVIFVYDLKHYIIPDKIIYPAIGVALIYNFLKFDFLGSPDFLLSALGAAAFFAAIVLISRGRWMGAGDIKLAFLMGLILGWPNILVALFLAFFLGAIVGVGLIFSGQKTLKSEIPFGPFLIFGTFSALFWGKEIIIWYRELFLL